MDLALGGAVAWKAPEKWPIDEEMEDASKCSKDARSQAYFHYCVTEAAISMGAPVGLG